MITPIENLIKRQWTISLVLKLFLGLVGLLVVLFAFTVVIDALIEISTHIAAVYSSSDSITRLLIWIIASVFFYKASPYIARVLKRV